MHKTHNLNALPGVDHGFCSIDDPLRFVSNLRRPTPAQSYKTPSRQPRQTRLTCSHLYL